MVCVAKIRTENNSSNDNIHFGGAQSIFVMITSGACDVFEPTSANAWWALMRRFPSARLSVCDYTKSH